MLNGNVATVDRQAEISLSFLNRFLKDYHPRDFAVRLWDDTTWDPDPGQQARFTLVIKHPGAFRRMLSPPSDLAVGEAFIYDDFDIEGDIEEALRVAETIVDSFDRKQLFDLSRYLLKLPLSGRQRAGRGPADLSGRAHSKNRDRQAVTYHYDVSNEFYRLWLDDFMVYSCAYFCSSDDDLNDAQEAKLDYICRKLRLKPGERLLDIGCGWGGLVKFAAENYGVIAKGVTLSEPQAELANRRIRESGLTGCCSVDVCDYRDLNEEESYDKLVSVGMFEHVGQALLPTYFDQAWRLLRPGGVFLNHGIANRVSEEQPKGARQTFINTYVFPDGELTNISTSLRAAEEAGFEVRDVESLREHYILTLRNWVRRLEAAHDQAVAVSDEVTYRIWRLFMSASAYGFRTGRINVYQTLLAKPDNGSIGLPLRRSDWYL
ncbi:MAG: class I SAM-dependent methyltransferase [Actinomycetota bacterium]